MSWTQGMAFVCAAEAAEQFAESSKKQAVPE
jgi:hypothetical protein